MWALPLGSYFDIRVRVSLIFIVWIVIELLTAYGRGGLSDLAFKGYFVAAMFVIVLLHEFGHCFACRWVKGEADEILMWMLGGLASCRPPHHWKASLITTIGGPAVHVLLWPVLAGAVLVTGMPAASLVFNPLSPYDNIAWTSTWQLIVWQTYLANVYLFLFNMMLPMFPMDGGRILQEVLWSRLGWARATKIAATTGVAIAIVVAMLGLMTGKMTLLGIAIFAGLTSWQTLQQLKFMGATGLAPSGQPWEADSEAWKMGGASAKRKAKDDLPGSWLKDDEPTAKDQEKAAQRAMAAAEARLKEEAELDRILSKIREQGMGSLTRTEESFLRRTTQEKKQGK